MQKNLMKDLGSKMTNIKDNPLFSECRATKKLYKLWDSSERYKKYMAKKFVEAIFYGYARAWKKDSEDWKK